MFRKSLCYVFSEVFKRSLDGHTVRDFFCKSVFVLFACIKLRVPSEISIVAALKCQKISEQWSPPSHNQSKQVRKPRERPRPTNDVANLRRQRAAEQEESGGPTTRARIVSA